MAWQNGRLPKGLSDPRCLVSQACPAVTVRICRMSCCLRLTVPVWLAAQSSVLQYNNLDITVLVTNQTGADTLLAIFGKAQADDVAVPGSFCTQNQTSWGLCSASLTNLDPTDNYWIWFINGCADLNLWTLSMSNDTCSAASGQIVSVLCGDLLLVACIASG